MADLTIAMNGYPIGTLHRSPSGAHEFWYSESWLNTPGARPISLSLPLGRRRFKGEVVYNFFDNLLPDNMQIRQRIVARYHAASSQPFDLLAEVGMDCVGALQIYPSGYQPEAVRAIHSKVLNETALRNILQGYRADAPLGMISNEVDFRISIAGAQEKTALLRQKGQWHLPMGSTPTTHIIKLPIGTIQSPSHTIDLSASVENELVCLRLAAALGLPVAEAEMMTTGDIRALSVTRFDRRLASDRQWIMRLPQEDFCQVLGVSPGLKYESDGGPGIVDIMTFLLGSAYPEQDRATFMRAQVVFWLLAATDGHAKNFSVYLLPDSAFRLTPLYDILSVYPVMGGAGLSERKVKMAMGLHGTKGRQYKWYSIFPRHFLTTAKAAGFDENAMQAILDEVRNKVPAAVATVRASLPADFPVEISEAIFEGMLKRAQRMGEIC
ncbi:type II toxin-antitoxin system HipA family toxin [Photobacterium sp. WH24]|uniref:type II toxin-antitoxin system HipA family toxin n=1 Tax=Photobacterium sp. WH24 TaxID=2827237 RepID=UPI001C45C090|nr:type II toxin-antitoxin system HipA family toxin [Photobacterium sp. WH24]MBV7261373.1 type II toxin-antitoxin system HipA family toxin [Photobacterium sp. WH24]